MKRYLFLKLGLTILVCAAASPRTQVLENFSSNRDGNSQKTSSKSVSQTISSSSLQRDPKTNLQDYQGVMGKPGVDFPVLTYIPRTKFTCRGKKSGYYADLETNCQVFHICDEGRKVSFLCPNGTIFQQSDLICDWWFKVDCAISPTLYDESAEQLYEENLKRKENRKVQEQERRASKLNRNQNSDYKQNRDFDKNRNSFSTVRENQGNFVKKDVNQYTSNQHNNYEENVNNYKESQVLSETASFVGNRYSNDQDKKYFKSVNDVRTDTHVTEFESTKSTTEKIINRGGRTFSNTFTNTKTVYRNQVPDLIKTTTQHTIYSPTVPPFTSTKYTTRVPLTTQTYKNVVPTSRNKPLTGFYITKELTPTTLTPFVTDYPTLIKPSSESTSPVFNRPRLYTSSPVPFTTSIPETRNKNTYLSKQEKENVYNDLNPYFTSTLPNLLLTTDFSTEYPFDDTTIGNTVQPSVPSPFKVQTENSKILPLKTDIKQSNYNSYISNSDNNKLPTPKPTIPTDYTTLNLIPTVTENLNNMIKTLEELDRNPKVEISSNFRPRPGLQIPPSAGPKTLHSLAIYFATALDNLVSSNDTDDGHEDVTQATVDDSQVTLLSRSTQEKYNLLFDEHKNVTENESDTTDRSLKEKSDIDIKSLVEHDAQYNDLDSQQSKGPISSTPRIRQLAQVFTQALSAYLDDPDTFKKVLEEIRPTEPPLLSNNLTESTLVTTLPSTITTEYHSYTKEEDEVLDFSDADKSSTYKPFVDNIRITQPTLYYQSTTEAYLNEITTNYPLKNSSSTNKYPTPNPLAIDLNNRLRDTNTSLNYYTESDEEISVTTESDDYFPFNNEDEEDAKLKATAKPYGLGFKPENSTPINLFSQISPNAANWINSIQSNSTLVPSSTLLPPFKVSILNNITDENINLDDEYLQSAYSQSFVPQINNTERKQKTLNINLNQFTTTEINDKETTTNTNNNFYTIPTTTESTTSYETESTTQLYTSKYIYDETTETPLASTIPDFKGFPTTTHEYSTTTDATTTTNVPESTTQFRTVSDNHWSKSPEVTKLWESTLYVDPLIINRNLGDSESTTFVDINTPTTYRPDFNTQSTQHRTTTEYPEYEDENIVSIKFTSTTEEPIETSSTLPSTTELNNIFTTVIDLGIHNLLNTTELEIASSQAHQIFGNLKSSEQDLLIEKMKEAESNSTVRRLILLLVSTCDASLSHNKTVQETRKSILDALLNVPPTNNRFGKQLTTTESAVETTSYPETTSTSDELSKKSSAITSANQVPNTNSNLKDINEDTRALELLRSLYSLAAKWGKK